MLKVYSKSAWTLTTTFDSYSLEGGFDMFNTNTVTVFDDLILYIWSIVEFYNPDGTLVFKWILNKATYDSTSSRGELEVYSLYYLLDEEYLNDGGNRIVSYTDEDIKDIVDDIITKYQWDAAYDWIDTSTLTATGISISITFDHKTYLQALDILQEYLNWDARIVYTLSGIINVLSWDSVTDVTYGAEMHDIRKNKSIGSVVNFIIIDNKNDIYEEYSDATSISTFGKKPLYISDPRILTVATANEIGQWILDQKSNPILQVSWGIIRDVSLSHNEKIAIQDWDDAPAWVLYITGLSYYVNWDIWVNLDVVPWRHKFTDIPVQQDMYESMEKYVSDYVENNVDPAFDWDTDLVFTATSYQQVNWAAGTIHTSWGDSYNIVAGNTWAMTQLLYIYLDTWVSTTVLQTTTNPANAVGDGKILVAVGSPVGSGTWALAEYQAFGTLGQWVLITSDTIAADAITADKIAANQINSTHLVTGSAVITGTAQIQDAIITSAKIASINADTITAGTITGRTVRTAASGSRVEMNATNNWLSVYRWTTKVAELWYETWWWSGEILDINLRTDDWENRSLIRVQNERSATSVELYNNVIWNTPLRCITWEYAGSPIDTYAAIFTSTGSNFPAVLIQGWSYGLWLEVETGDTILQDVECEDLSAHALLPYYSSSDIGTISDYRDDIYVNDYYWKNEFNINCDDIVYSNSYSANRWFPITINGSQYRLLLYQP
jgi:acetone carboxylase gamma subunit